MGYVRDWFKDLLGVGSGDTFGVQDETGAYSGPLGINAGVGQVEGGPTIWDRLGHANLEFWHADPDPLPTPVKGDDGNYTYEYPEGTPWDKLTPEQIKTLFENAQTQAETDMQPLYDALGSQEDGTGLWGLIGGIPSYSDWEAQRMQQNPSLQGAGGIAALIQGLSGEMAGLDPNSADAKDYAAEMAGYGSWDERQEAMQDIRDAMSGMTDENGQIRGEIGPEYQRAMRMTMADAERRAQRLIADSFSESGSFGRMMLQADETMMSMANTEAQMQYQAIAADRDAKMQQYQTYVEQLNSMLESGRMSTTDYVETKRLALGDAMSGYVESLEQLRESYQLDYDAYMDTINATMAGIQTQLGVTMAEYEASSQLAAQALAPYYTAAELEQLADAMSFDFSDVVSLVTAAAEIIAVL